MEAGHWFLSLYNDDGEPRSVQFRAKVSTELTRNCPMGCNGKGECVLGKCQCQPGFDGPDCGQSKSELFTRKLLHLLPSGTPCSQLAMYSWVTKHQSYKKERPLCNLIPGSLNVSINSKVA